MFSPYSCMIKNLTVSMFVYLWKCYFPKCAFPIFFSPDLFVVHTITNLISSFIFLKPKVCFFPSWGKFGTRLTWKFIYFSKRETFKLVGWCWSSQESEAIDFVGIYCLLFFLKVKFSCCIPDRGQSGRGERPCDTAQACQVIFSRLLIFWSSACIPQIGQLNRQRLNVSMH